MKKAQTIHNSEKEKGIKIKCRLTARVCRRAIHAGRIASKKDKVEKSDTNRGKQQKPQKKNREKIRLGLDNLEEGIRNLGIL